jgi:hypothetical protein
MTTEPISHATFDPTDAKIRIYSDHVSRPLFDRLRELGFQRAPKQGCFFAVWSPKREDTALELCGEIVPEDTTLEDRALDRAERFAGYSENAAARNAAAHKASHDAVKHIPLGQPIMIGHHSAKRHRAALKKSHRAMDRAVKEADKRDRWASRSEDVLRHAARKFTPAPIWRKLRKLESDRRGAEKDMGMSQENKREITCQWLDEHHPQGRDAPYVPYSARFHALGQDERDELNTHLHAIRDRRRAHYGRWVKHYDEQIAFWQGVYDELGGLPLDGIEIKKGGWVQTGRGWAKVERVNRDKSKRIKSVSLDRGTIPSYSLRVVGYDDLIGYSEHKPGADVPLPDVRERKEARIVMRPIKKKKRPTARRKP